MRISTILPTLALLGAPGAAAQTVYVSASLTTGADDGLSWADAYRGSVGLRRALSEATSGTEIWVTEGLYLPSSTGDPTDSFEIDSVEIVVRGGFLGGESTIFERPPLGTALTTLSGDLAGNDDGTPASGTDNSHNVVTVAIADGEIVLDRLRIVAGSAIVPGTNQRFGHAVYGWRTFSQDDFGGLTMEDCTIERCFGWGVTLDGWFPDHLIQARITDCVLQDIAEIGLAVTDSELIVDRCRVKNCGAVGIALHEIWATDTMIRNSLIEGCGREGILFDFSGSFGAVPAALIQGCTVVDNAFRGVRERGAWTSNSLPPYPIVVRNSIVVGHGVEIDGNVRAEHSIIEGGSAGPGNLDVDPRFRDPGAGDFTLLSSSPAIDRGASTGLLEGELDVARRYRAVDVLSVPNSGSGTPEFVDLGAFEFSGTFGDNGDCAAEPNSTGRPGRLFARGSASVAANDLTLLADQLPPGQFGIFVVSQQLGFTPMAGGLGTLCIGGAIGRFNRPGEIRLSDPSGALTFPVDLTDLPRPGTTAAARPGETWRFQLWHRDVPQAGVSTNQLTGLLSIPFE